MVNNKRLYIHFIEWKSYIFSFCSGLFSLLNLKEEEEERLRPPPEEPLTMMLDLWVLVIQMLNQVEPLATWKKNQKIKINQKDKALIPTIIVEV